MCFDLKNHRQNHFLLDFLGATRHQLTLLIWNNVIPGTLFLVVNDPGPDGLTRSIPEPRSLQNLTTNTYAMWVSLKHIKRLKTPHIHTHTRRHNQTDESDLYIIYTLHKIKCYKIVDKKLNPMLFFIASLYYCHWGWKEKKWNEKVLDGNPDIVDAIVKSESHIWRKPDFGER